MEHLQGAQQIVHFHNYSMYAVKSLICEIKKFPIVYKNHSDICYARELTDLAWCRIIHAVLDCDDQLSCTQKAYWEISFRELWKWMRSLLVKDMKARLEGCGYFRDPKYNWLEHLKFAEKHICLEQESVGADDPGKGIHIRLISAETIRESSRHTVIWVRDSRESSNDESEGVSICMRAPLVPAEDMFVRDSIPTPPLSFDSNTFKACYSPVIDLMPTSTPTRIQSPSCSSTQVTQEDQVVPQQQVVQLVIDEDFQFIMSLLPKLKKLEPKMNTEVKTMIMQALHETF